MVLFTCNVVESLCRVVAEVGMSAAGAAVVTGSGEDAQREEDRAAADTIDQLNHGHRSPGAASASSVCADDSQPYTFHGMQPQREPEDEMILPTQNYRYGYPEQYSMPQFAEEVKRDEDEHSAERYDDILELGRRNLDACSEDSGRSSNGVDQDNKESLLDLHRHREPNFVHLTAALHSPSQDPDDYSHQSEPLVRLQPYQQHEVIQHSNNYQP